MTTFQDPPPQSRRAVRQSERGETPDQQPVQQPYSFESPQPAGQQPPAQSAPPLVEPPRTGRRAQQPTAPQAPPGGFEPLTYVTQGRVPLPPYDTPGASAASAPDAYRQPPPPSDSYTQQSLAHQPPPGQRENFRVRDFSPEGRRSAINREQAPTVAQAPPPTMAPPVAPAPVAAPPADLDYQTQGRANAGSHSAQRAPVDESMVNHTLTRRELRELRAAEEANAPELRLPEPIDALLNSGPIELPTLAPPPGQSQALADAMAEFDSLTRARREAEARARDAQVASLTPPPPQQYAQPSAPQPVQPFGVGTAPQQFIQPSAPELPVSSAPYAAPPMAPPPPAGFAMEQAAPPAMDPVFIEPPRPAPTRPKGHWSTQAEAEDELPYENTLSRTVGTGTSAITTSALVLPSVPTAHDLTRSLNSTGEILMTGSIDLPRSLGATGAHPNRVDNSDYEDDPFDSQVISADSSPVRAIRAVSTHTSTRGVIETKRPQSNRGLTIIIAIAGVLVVGVVGIFVFAALTHQL